MQVLRAWHVIVWLTTGAVATALLSGCLGDGGPGTDAATGGPAGGRTVTGTVTDAVTSQPIAGATITAAGTSASAASGEDGTYTISGVPQQSATLQFSASEYQTATKTVADTATTVNAQLFTIHSGSVAGRLTNAFGAPVASGRVSVDGLPLATSSDTGGNYQLNGVPAGQRTVTASAAGYHSQSRSLSVVEAQRLAMNFRLDSAPNAQAVRGSVTDALGGHGIAGAVVWAGSISAVTDTDGLYLFPDVSGPTLTMSVTVSGYLDASATVSLQGAETVVDFALIPDSIAGPPSPPT